MATILQRPKTELGGEERRPSLLRQVYSLRGVPQARIWGIPFRTAELATLALALLGLVGLLYLTQASQVTTTSQDIRQMEAHLADIERQNALLSLEVSRLEEPARIETRARAMGLTTTIPIQYVYLPRLPGERRSEVAAREVIPQGAVPLSEQELASLSQGMGERGRRMLSGMLGRIRARKAK